MFRRNGVPRSFARKVLADRLPPEILNEHRRGAQVPDWFRRLQARRQDIATEIERIDASSLARCLIDVPRLKKLMAQWPKDEHAAEKRAEEYKFALARGVHAGQFIRWVEGGNALRLLGSTMGEAAHKMSCRVVRGSDHVNRER